MLGVVDKLVERGIAPTGTTNIGGSLVTAGGLVFIGATNDSRFRAFDKDTGKELWVTRLPASAHATPMTFRGRKSGRQFVVVAAGGGNKYNQTYSDSLVAFALPVDERAGAAGPVLARHGKGGRAGSARGGAARGRAEALFSHQRHAGLKLECTYCHAGAATGGRAGFPAASKCMACHRGVAAERPEIRRLAAHVRRRRLWHRKIRSTGCRTSSFSGTDDMPKRASRARRAMGTCGEWSASSPVLEMKMRACVDCHKAQRAAVSCTVCHELSQ